MFNVKARSRAETAAGSALLGGWHPRFELPALSYEESALSPAISARALRIHHRQIHEACCDEASHLATGRELEELPLEEVVRRTAGDPLHVALFRYAAEAWNHAFYWQSLRPGGGGRPYGAIEHHIDQAFGTYDNFRSQFVGAASDRFGNGWAWLIMRRDRLAIVCTDGVNTPMVFGGHCLLAIDVWEHAYYLDYGNSRRRYVEALVDTLLNWDFANERLTVGT